jgi:uncharacterized membrane protein YqjE
VEEPGKAAGALDSLRALGATLVEAVETRVELALVELREEGERRKAMLVLAVTGALFLSLGLLLAAFFVVVFFWDTHRLEAIAGVTLLYLGIAAGAFLRLRANARSAPAPFEATLRELAADRDLLRGRRE